MNPTIDEFLKAHAPTRMPENCFTIAQAMEKWGLSDTQARRRLAALVADGVLERLDNVILPSGNNGTAYRIMVK